MGLNKTNSIGPTSQLIRQCSPKTFEEWEDYYFEMHNRRRKMELRLHENISHT